MYELCEAARGVRGLFDLSGKVAAITGATGGIGEGLSLALAAAGADVALLGRREERLSSLAATIAGEFGVAATWHAADVLSESAAEATFESIASHHGCLDILVNAAGVAVLVTERRCGVVSREIMQSAGVDSLDYRLVVVKLGYLWDALRPLATRAIIALTPGATCEVLEKVPYRHLSRPIYPLDKDFEW